MAVPATRVLMHMEADSDADINIKVTGYQWKWKYDYLDEGISFFSNLSTPQDQINGMAPKGKWYLLEVDNPVVVPRGAKVRLLFTSNEVIPYWWVVDLAIKKESGMTGLSATGRGVAFPLQESVYHPCLVSAMPG